MVRKRILVSISKFLRDSFDVVNNIEIGKITILKMFSEFRGIFFLQISFKKIVSYGLLECFLFLVVLRFKLIKRKDVIKLLS